VDFLTDLLSDSGDGLSVYEGFEDSLDYEEKPGSGSFILFDVYAAPGEKGKFTVDSEFKNIKPRSPSDEKERMLFSTDGQGRYSRGFVDRKESTGFLSDPSWQVVLPELDAPDDPTSIQFRSSATIEPLESAIPGASSNRLARQLAQSPIQVGSAVLLGFVVALLGVSWPPNIGLILACIISLGAAVLSLLVKDSRTALANSRLLDLLVVALSPPAE
jgi:hypothetical protein